MARKRPWIIVSAAALAAAGLGTGYAVADTSASPDVPGQVQLTGDHADSAADSADSADSPAQSANSPADSANSPADSANSPADSANSPADSDTDSPA